MNDSDADESVTDTSDCTNSPAQAPEWLRVAFKFGSGCLRDQQLQPRDVFFLTCHAAATMGLPRLVRPGRVERHHITAVLRTTLCVVGAHPGCRVLAALAGLQVPSPLDGPAAVADALWDEYWQWWKATIEPEASDDARVKAAQRRLRGFSDLHVAPLVAKESPLRCLRGAIRQVAEQSKIPATELWRFAREDAGTAELTGSKADEIPTERLLSDLLPFRDEDAEGWMRLSQNGKLSWNYNKAADRLRRSLERERKQLKEFVPASQVAALDLDSQPTGSRLVPIGDPVEEADYVDLTRLVARLRANFQNTEQVAAFDVVCDGLTQEDAAARHGITRKVLRRGLTEVKATAAKVLAPYRGTMR